MPTVTTTTTTVAQDGSVTTTTVTTTEASTASTKAPTREQVLSSKWPRKINEVTTEWLSALMEGEVAGYDVKTIESGVLSQLYILTLKYAGAVGTAPTVVLKLPSLDDTTRQSSIRCYEKEMNFYSELAEKVSLKVPSIFGIWRDPAAPNEYFCIAMEDLSFKNNPLNQVIGISMPLQKLLLERMANFNAEFYGSSVLSAKWLDTATPDHPYNPWFGDWVGQFLKDPSCWTPFLEAVKRYDEIQVIDVGQNNPDLLAILDIISGPKGPKVVNKFYEKLASRPHTMIHADTRCDNVFLAKDESDFVFVDWQMCGKGPIGIELMACLGYSMADIKDYSNLNALIEGYYNTVKEGAPDMCAKYSLAEVKSDMAVALGIFYPSCFAAVVGPLFKVLPLDHGLWSLLIAVAERAQETMRQLGSVAAIKALEAEV